MIVLVVFEQALALDLIGPAEVFSTAHRLLPDGRSGYDLVYGSAAGGLIPTSCGVAIETRALASLDLSRVDTVIAVGGPTAESFTADSPVVDWIRRASTVARRTCSVCSGAFLLAAAGLLDGRRAVTHWRAVDRLREAYPKVRVELDPIYVKDGAIWTSAGMSAGIDLALALVADDHGRRLSLAVAKDLVVLLHRSGGQAQFSSALAAQSRLGATAAHSKLSELPAWIVSNLGGDLSVETLAASVGMTPRTFARKFVEAHGCTPAKLVEDLRIEAACRLLEEDETAIKQIASVCGFGDEERMRRTFLRHLGVPPSAYRDRFGVRKRSNVDRVALGDASSRTTGRRPAGLEA